MKKINILALFTSLLFTSAAWAQTITPYVCNIGETKAGEKIIGDGRFMITKDGQNLLKTDRAAIVFDKTIGRNVLRVTTDPAQLWSTYLLLKLDTKLEGSKKLILRMRFEKDYLQKTDDTRARVEDGNAISVFTRVAGIPKGESEPVYSERTRIQKWVPSLEYTDYTIDLTAIIERWESNDGVGKPMEELSYVRIYFPSVNKACYQGDYYVESVRFGE